MGGAADELPRRDIHGTTAWSRSLHADDDDCHGSFQAELFGKLRDEDGGRAKYCQPNLDHNVSNCHLRFSQFSKRTKKRRMTDKPFHVKSKPIVESLH